MSVEFLFHSVFVGQMYILIFDFTNFGSFSEEMSIEVRFLSKQYRDQNALDAVSFDVVLGEQVGVLEINGSGESTLTKILI
ncbi:MAG: hypothetical protein ABI045_04010 [Flavobacteriales bacterium]